MILAKNFYQVSAPVLAKTLLGKLLVHQTKYGIISGKIVETEAYLANHDPASHSFRGETERNKMMFGPGGLAYIYFTYGMHYCLNAVSSKIGRGEAVLIRALEPVDGLQFMQKMRSQTNIKNLCNGPAKLCQALMIDKSLNGVDLTKSNLMIKDLETIKPKDILTTTRIGITEAKALNLRFYIKNNPFVSVRP